MGKIRKIIKIRKIRKISKISDYEDTVHLANKYIETNENKVKNIINDHFNFKQNYNDLLSKYNLKNDKLNVISNELNDLQDQNTNLTNMVKK